MTGVDPGTWNPGHQPVAPAHVHPTWQNPPYTPVPGRIRTWWAAAGSLHTGGATSSWATAPCGYIWESTAMITLNAMSTMSGGEVFANE